MYYTNRRLLYFTLVRLSFEQTVWRN